MGRGLVEAVNGYDLRHDWAVHYGSLGLFTLWNRSLGTMGMDLVVWVVWQLGYTHCSAPLGVTILCLSYFADCKNGRGQFQAYLGH